MKLTATLILAACLNVSANGYAQQVTLLLRNSTLKKVFKEIKKQTGYNFLYTAELINEADKVDVWVKNASIDMALQQCLGKTTLSYAIIEKTIVIKRKENIKKEIEAPLLFQTIRGKITDETGTPLLGVSILLKGTSKGTVTDSNGNFELEIPDNSSKILIVSYVGMEQQEISIAGKTEIAISLRAVSNQQQEAVIVAYGTQKKVNLTGSVSTVSGEQLENRPITQASQALAGLVSGVTVTQGSGRPGSDASTIQIRGLGTFSEAGNEPLVLIDGLASSINDVDPNNIESISVLKDAASASIYGTRAANGVVLIKTKRGQKGRLQVGYNNYVGWQKVTEVPDFLPSWEFATLTNEANANLGINNSYTDADIEKYKSGTDPDNYPNVPHLKNLLQSGSGFQTNHNVNFTGGDERNSYLFSVSYLGQNGVVAKDNYKKYNFLLNFDSRIKDNLLLRVNLSGYDATTNEPRHSGGDVTDIIAAAVRQPSIYAGRKSDGTYGHQDNYSPEAWLASESFSKNKNKMFLGGAELIWEVIQGLSLSGKVGYNYSNSQFRSFTSTMEFDPVSSLGPNSLSVGNAEGSIVTLQSLLQYAKKLGEHNFNVLAGFSQESSRDRFQTGYRSDFPNNLLFELNAGASSSMTNEGSGSEFALRSYFGRLNYSFKEKYLFEANARYDGTSRFPQAGRWGLFPSFSIGWRISEEPFVKNNAAWINNLKFRASWGKLGNQNIGNYPYQSFITLGRDYTFGGNTASGAAVTTLANKDITWESTTITDVGLDLTVMKGSLNMVVDYFQRRTSGILYSVAVSGILGLTPSEVNAGGVENKGFEIFINYHRKIGPVSFNLIPNFSYTKNEVTELGNGLQKSISADNGSTGLFVGHSLGAIYGLEADGLFVDANDIASYASQPYTAMPGSIRYKDISGPNGKPDGIVDPDNDRTVIGSSFPKYAYGATLATEYKGFYFSLLLQGLSGLEKQLRSYGAFAFYNAGQIQRWQADGRWTTQKPDRNASYPALTPTTQNDGNTFVSTFWNRSGGFLRAKNVQLGYNFSPAVLKKLKVNKLGVFISGQNLFSFNKFYKGWDPEVVQDPYNYAPTFYPITSIYTVGMNVKF
ncbi:MAG: TonB-dependent receptor [Chitinophagaceae bacterium]|nr:TonB-dependent receptor [Chitinophagaceae bacterium]